MRLRVGRCFFLINIDQPYQAVLQRCQMGHLNMANPVLTYIGSFCFGDLRPKKNRQPSVFGREFPKTHCFLDDFCRLMDRMDPLKMCRFVQAFLRYKRYRGRGDRDGLRVKQ